MVSTESIRPDEPGMGVNTEDTPVTSLMARILERENLRRAQKQMIRNKGAPGIDGMTVEQLPGYLKHHWPRLRDQLQNGTYHPQAVKRITIPKPTGAKDISVSPPWLIALSNRPCYKHCNRTGIPASQNPVTGFAQNAPRIKRSFKRNNTCEKDTPGRWTWI